MMLTIDMIKHLGVDMSITKQDLIDLITQDLKDAADEELEAAKQSSEEAKAAKQEFYAHHKEVHKNAVASDPKVVAAIEALDALTNRSHHVAFFEHAVNMFAIVPKDYTLSVYSVPYSYVKLDVPTRPSYPAEEEQELLRSVREADARYCQAVNRRNNLENNTARAKVAFIRDLLGASEDGKLLLSVLDAKTAKAGIRKLKSHV